MSSFIGSSADKWEQSIKLRKRTGQKSFIDSALKSSPLNLVEI